MKFEALYEPAASSLNLFLWDVYCHVHRFINAHHVQRLATDVAHGMSAKQFVSEMLFVINTRHDYLIQGLHYSLTCVFIEMISHLV